MLFVAALATWPTWWGGLTYGPRLFTDLCPLLVLAMGDGLRLSRETRHRRLFTGLFVAAMAFSVFTAARGYASSPVYLWNGGEDKSRNVDLHQERLWDWTDMQIFTDWSPM